MPHYRVAAQGAQRRNRKVVNAKRQIRVIGDIAFVPLTKGYEAIIDAADAPMVEGRLWRALVVRRKDGSIRTIYATSRASGGQTIYLHRLIAGEPEGAEVDHRDGDGLLNIRSNLRVCSTSQNHCNRRLSIRNTSGFKGASWNASVGKWLARIKVNGKRHNLGHFLTPEEAHAAYVAASLKYHGEFGNHG
jgi:hypothetical protein